MGNNDIKSDLSNILTTEQVAEKIGISPKTLKDWRHDNKGPKYWKNGRLIRYYAEEVNAWFTQAFTPIDPGQL
ncbi:MAG: helix-turn-helix domain-containing protein [Phycisphaerae bacterium]|nr:helix-turn-helix domain-containing protein [Phycisphaerae bacterium]